MDARSLLRAKKAEARIEHPYAAYSARGELRCSVCAVPVKQWDAHLLTKQHRTSAAREKANQAAQAKKSASAAAPTKRAAAGDDDMGGGEPIAKRSKPSSGPAGLPEGFFSNGNAPAEEEDNDDKGQEEENRGGPSSAAPMTAELEKPTGDNELDDFLASLSTPTGDGEDTSAVEYGITKATTTQTKRKNIPKYKEVEPGQASYEAAPVRNIPQGETEVEEALPEESEKEKRERIVREEREEIVRRLEEEERAQEDADSRVTSLKERMAMLKKRREAKAGAGGAGGSKAKEKGKGKSAVDGSDA